jgi:protein-tyrosine-phosphatase
MAQRRFQAFSAGSEAKGEVHPLAIDVLRRNRLPTENLRSKSWTEFAAPDAPALDFVFTVCDRAAAEVCPVWPGQPITAHWVDREDARERPDEVRHEQGYDPVSAGQVIAVVCRSKTGEGADRRTEAPIRDTPAHLRARKADRHGAGRSHDRNRDTSITPSRATNVTRERRSAPA